MNEILSGVLPVLHLPYDENFEIDWPTLEAEIDFAFECGADGVVAAMVTEVLRLTFDERRQLAEFGAKSARGRGPMVMSVGAESTFAATELARAAEAAGANALMAIAPISVAADESQLRAYFAAIVEATTLPLVIQDASGYVGRPMTAAFQAALHAEWGERIAFKPEAAPVGPVISELNERSGGRALIFEGSGGTALVENFRRGITGTMPGTDLLDAIVALWRALQSGDEERIYAISPLIGAILSIAVGLDGYLALEKHLMVRRGIFRNTLVRGPVGFALDPPAREELDRLFDRLQNVLAGG